MFLGLKFEKLKKKTTTDEHQLERIKILIKKKKLNYISKCLNDFLGFLAILLFKFLLIKIINYFLFFVI